MWTYYSQLLSQSQDFWLQGWPALAPTQGTECSLAPLLLLVTPQWKASKHHCSLTSGRVLVPWGALSMQQEINEHIGVKQEPSSAFRVQVHMHTKRLENRKQEQGRAEGRAAWALQ